MYSTMEDAGRRLLSPVGVYGVSESELRPAHIDADHMKISPSLEKIFKP